MAKHLSVGTVIEKNRIASENAFIILLQLDVKDENGDPVTTIRFCQNSENVVYGGETYYAGNFTLDFQNENGKEPAMSIAAQDQTKTLTQYVDAYDGLTDNEVIITVVNTGNIDGPPEMQETFKIVSSSIKNYVVTFQLGIESAVNKRFPNYRQFKDRCQWRYKGLRCGYAGAMTSCDYTLKGANGCVAHGNQNRFGAFPGLNNYG